MPECVTGYVEDVIEADYGCGKDCMGVTLRLSITALTCMQTRLPEHLRKAKLFC